MSREALTDFAKRLGQEFHVSESAIDRTELVVQGRVVKLYPGTILEGQWPARLIMEVEIGEERSLHRMPKGRIFLSGEKIEAVTWRARLPDGSLVENTFFRPAPRPRRG